LPRALEEGVLPEPHGVLHSTQLHIPDYMKSGREVIDSSKPRDIPLPASQECHPQLVQTKKYFAPSNTEDAKLLEGTPNSSGRRSRE
jgi:hypothetical protein